MKSNFKFLLILSILLLGCICVGSTFAADISVSNVDNAINLESIDDSSQNDVEINNLQAGEGNFTELQKIIDDANGTLILDKNYKYVSEDNMEDGVIINNPLIIDGQGHTLDASDLVRIFVVNSNDVTLKNINFINGDAEIGSAIYWNDGDNGRVTDCKFINCIGFNSGAIYWGGDNGAVIGCEFINCSCDAGLSDGGAIFWMSGENAMVKDCNFTNCYAHSGGAIYFYEVSNFNVDACNFKDNIAGDKISMGGAIYIRGAGLNGTIKKCNFTNCNATGYISSGGAICWEKGNYTYIESCNFINCSATDCGGAISWWCSYCNINDCNFTNCFAQNYGGAIDVYCDIYGINYTHIDISNCNNVPVAGDFKPPIYNCGIILSDVVITTIDGDVKKVKYGETVDLTGTVTASGIPVAGRLLILNVNGKEINADSDDHGLFSANYTVDFIGEMNVDATYEGSTGSETVNMGKLVSSKSGVIVTVDDVKGKVGDKVKFTAKIYDSEGNPVKEGVVIFGFDGKEYKANIINGIAAVEVVLPKAGNYSATAYYDGDEFHESAYAVFNVEVTNNTNPDPINKSGIPMEQTGNPLIVLLFALISLPLIRRK